MSDHLTIPAKHFGASLKKLACISFILIKNNFITDFKLFKRGLNRPKRSKADFTLKNKSLVGKEDQKRALTLRNWS